MARVAPRAVPLMDHELVSSTRTAPGTVLLEPVSPSMPPSPPILLAAVERRDATGLQAVRHLGWQLLATDGLRSSLARRRLLREAVGARTG